MGGKKESEVGGGVRNTVEDGPHQKWAGARRLNAGKLGGNDATVGR